MKSVYKIISIGENLIELTPNKGYLFQWWEKYIGLKIIIDDSLPICSSIYRIEDVCPIIRFGLFKKLVKKPIGQLIDLNCCQKIDKRIDRKFKMKKILK